MRNEIGLSTAIAHEIKNPVALARTHVGLIRLADKEQILLDYCDRIEQALDHINHLVQEFMQAGDEAVSPAIFDITELLTELTNEYRLAWPEGKFSFQHPTQPILINYERSKLRLVFSNLIKNAVEAGVGKSLVEITAASDYEKVIISVRDHGNGLDDSFRTHLPEAGRYTSKPGGSGMGLVVCEAILARCGGQLKLENHAQGGCEAAVILTK